MNGLEREYNTHLELNKSLGLVKDIFFEGIKLKINKACTYTPDFMVINAENEVEFHEVKGTRGKKGEEKPFYHDDAIVKLKAVADKYPFKFIMVYKASGEWQEVLI